MIDTKQFGINNYYLVCTNAYAGKNVNYSLQISDFEPVLNISEGQSVKIKNFSDKLLTGNKKVKKLPLPVIDMFTSQYKDADDMLKRLKDDVINNDIIYNVYVGYQKNNYYACNPAIFNDKAISNIASKVRSNTHSGIRNERKAPLIDLKDDYTVKWYSYLKYQLLENDEFANYYKNTSNKDHFNRVDTYILDLLDEYRRYKASLNHHYSSAAYEDMDACERDIRRELVVYKTFRTVYLAEKKFRYIKEEEKKAKEAPIPEIKKEEPKVLVKTPVKRRSRKNKYDNPNQMSFFDDEFGLK